MSGGRRSRGAANGMAAVGGRLRGARVSARTRVVDGTVRLWSCTHWERVNAEDYPHSLDGPLPPQEHVELLRATRGKKKKTPSERGRFFAQGGRARTCRFFVNFDCQRGESLSLAHLESREFFLASCRGFHPRREMLEECAHSAFCSSSRVLFG